MPKNITQYLKMFCAFINTLNNAFSEANDLNSILLKIVKSFNNSFPEESTYGSSFFKCCACCKDEDNLHLFIRKLPTLATDRFKIISKIRYKSQRNQNNKDHTILNNHLDLLDENLRTIFIAFTAKNQPMALPSINPKETLNNGVVTTLPVFIAPDNSTPNPKENISYPDMDSSPTLTPQKKITLRRSLLNVFLDLLYYDYFYENKSTQKENLIQKISNLIENNDDKTDVIKNKNDEKIGTIENNDDKKIISDWVSEKSPKSQINEKNTFEFSTINP